MSAAADDRPHDAEQAEVLPAWKRRMFIAATMGVPVALVLALELALRLFGWGGYPAFIRDAGELRPGERLCLVEPAATKPYFFANPTRPGYAEETNFRMPKPAGTVRIFVIGESAAKGYPQPRNLSMSSFLRAMLEDAWPGRAVEVINMGTTAVASFPLVSMMDEVVEHDPDLVVLYVGNNEFFGAYGTASINAVGTMPTWALPVMRAVRGLAVVQAFDAVVHRGADEDRTLMEQMVGQAVIAADSPLRASAARNLGTHLGQMIDAAKDAGVPVLVCTTASNEAGLAPLGEGSAAAARFQDARRMAASGDRAGAREAFLDARDLDTMPWRPIRATEEAIRAAAREHGAPLCDIAAEFRELGPDAATGWELLDDHVHLSVRGQAEAARAMVRAMSGLPPPVAVDSTAAAALPAWQSYAARLGTNPWDDYRVNHTLRVLFGVPFMRRTNPEAFARFDGACRAFEATMSPPILAVAREWQSGRVHAGATRPLTGMVARILLRENRVPEAATLYEIARRQVPDYNSWHLEYTYFLLACRERLNGSLDDADRAMAAAAVDEGRFLLEHGFSESGMAERYVGRLLQLRGGWAEAIPFLEAARPKMAAEDLVACDQALVLSYIRAGRAQDALGLVDRGIRESGRFAPVYRRMREEIARGAAESTAPR
jgi:lysophospholipase L1-like esterase